MFFSRTSYMALASASRRARGNTLDVELNAAYGTPRANCPPQRGTLLLASTELAARRYASAPC
eukprot:4214993-Lingulodinium_polyedra.AAC.1